MWREEESRLTPNFLVCPTERRLGPYTEMEEMDHDMWVIFRPVLPKLPFEMWRRQYR